MTDLLEIHNKQPTWSDGKNQAPCVTGETTVLLYRDTSICAEFPWESNTGVGEEFSTGSFC